MGTPLDGHFRDLAEHRQRRPRLKVIGGSISLIHELAHEDQGRTQSQPEHYGHKHNSGFLRRHVPTWNCFGQDAAIRLLKSPLHRRFFQTCQKRLVQGSRCLDFTLGLLQSNQIVGLGRNLLFKPVNRTSQRGNLLFLTRNIGLQSDDDGIDSRIQFGLTWVAVSA